MTRGNSSPSAYGTKADGPDCRDCDRCPGQSSRRRARTGWTWTTAEAYSTSPGRARCAREGNRDRGPTQRRPAAVFEPGRDSDVETDAGSVGVGICLSGWAAQRRTRLSQRPPRPRSLGSLAVCPRAGRRLSAVVIVELVVVVSAARQAGTSTLEGWRWCLRRVWRGRCACESACAGPG